MRNTPSRNQQRQIILDSQFCQSGDEFNRSHIAVLLHSSNEQAASLLSAMADDGVLNKRMTKQGAKTFIFYSKRSKPLLRRPWRSHTDEELGITEDQDMTTAAPIPVRQHAEWKPSGDTLTIAEVADICRAHFSTFGNLQAAAEHYGLSDGRMSQIQTGIDVRCPRVLKALGIVRSRDGVFRRVEILEVKSQ